MKYSTILLALAATVYAQSLEQLVADIPACAVDCMANAATKNGCGVADYDCQCGEKYEQLFTVAQPCVREACETGELTGKFINAINASSTQTDFQQVSLAVLMPSASTSRPIPAPAATNPLLHPMRPLPMLLRPPPPRLAPMLPPLRPVPLPPPPRPTTALPPLRRPPLMPQSRLALLPTSRLLAVFWVLHWPLPPSCKLVTWK